MDDKSVNVLEIFTRQMIEDAKKCKNAQEILHKVISPNMKRIDEKTGQENNALYWAYVMEHIINELKGKNYTTLE
jgi:hypothetical protein